MKIYCAECKKETNHSLLKEGVRKEVAEYDNFIWSEYKWYVYECIGCDHVTFLKEDYYSEDYEYNEELEENYIEPYRKVFYPSKEIIDKELILKQAYLNIPKDIDNLYGEVVTAYNSKSYVLASIGIRTLLEAILNEKSVEGDNLWKKINNAEFIPGNIRTNIHALRVIGNTATHENDTPDIYDLLQAIEIIQDILNIAYSLDYKSTLLYTKVKNRKKTI